MQTISMVRVVISFGVVVLAADEGDRAVLRVQLMRQLIQRVPVIVGILWEMLQIRLVAKAPQHHTGWFLSRWIISASTCR